MRARFVTVGRSFKERKRKTRINPVVLVRIRGINMDLQDPKTYTQRERERETAEPTQESVHTCIPQPHPLRRTRCRHPTAAVSTLSPETWFLNTILQ